MSAPSLPSFASRRRFVPFATTLVLAAAPFVAAACGSGAKTPAAAPPGTGNAGPDASITEGPGSASSEPPSTTTDTLGTQGDVDGGKLPEVAAPAGSMVTDAGVMVVVGDGGSARGRDDLMAAVLARRPQARACYDAGRKNHPEISGKLNIHFVIDPKGNVIDAQLGPESDITDGTVVACVIDVIKKIQFGPNPNGRNTIVNYPFKFTPNGG